MRLEGLGGGGGRVPCLNTGEYLPGPWSPLRTHSGGLTLARPHYPPLIGLYHLYRSQAN